MSKRTSSGASQPADSEGTAKKKRKVSGVSQPADSEGTATQKRKSSGVSQPADNEGSRILLVDAGRIRDRIRQKLVNDERKPATVDEMMEIAQQFNVGCIVGTDFPTWDAPEASHMQSRSLCTEETSWHVWYDPDTWTLSGFELQDLGACHSLSAHPPLRNRHCAILNLRYHDDTRMRVMVMKKSEGKSCGGRHPAARFCQA